MEILTRCYIFKTLEAASAENVTVGYVGYNGRATPQYIQSFILVISCRAFHRGLLSVRSIVNGSRRRGSNIYELRNELDIRDKSIKAIFSSYSEGSVLSLKSDAACLRTF